MSVTVCGSMTQSNSGNDTAIATDENVIHSSAAGTVSATALTGQILRRAIANLFHRSGERHGVTYVFVKLLHAPARARVATLQRTLCQS
jgi:hypothetical protein